MIEIVLVEEQEETGIVIVGIIDGTDVNRSVLADPLETSVPRQSLQSEL